MKNPNNSIYDSIEKNKFLGISLTKEVQDLYTRSYSTLLKELREELNKWKTSNWLEDNIVKMAIFPKLG